MTQKFLGEIRWLGAMDACSEKCKADFATNPIGMLACFAQCNVGGATPPVAPPGGVTLPQGWTIPKGWTLPGGMSIPPGQTIPGLPGVVTPPGFTLPPGLPPLPFDWKLLTDVLIPAGAPLPAPPACPAGTMWLQAPGLPGTCVPTSPPPGWFPPTGMPTSQPTHAAIVCVTDCEKKFGMSAPGGLNPVELANCLTKCAQAAAPATVPGGGQPPPGGGGQQPPPGGGGQQPPPAAPAAAPSSSGTAVLVIGAIGVAVIGALLVMVGRQPPAKMLENARWANTGARERLFLLSQVGPTSINHYDWRYDPSRDHWFGGWPSGPLRVTREGSASLEKIARVYGISRRDAMRLIGMAEK